MRKITKQSEYRKDKIGTFMSLILLSHQPRTKIEFMKSKGKIKLSENKRNKVDLICETPCHSTRCKVFGKICKRNQSQTIYTYIPYLSIYLSVYPSICIIHTLHIKILTSLGWKDTVPVENQYYQL